MKLWSFLKVSPILIPFIIGVYKYRDIRTLRFLFYFVCYGVVNELVSKILKLLEIKNSMPFGHVYVLVSFTFLCLYYKTVFKDYISKIWFNGLIIFYVIFCIVNVLFFQSIIEYPGWPFSILSITMVAFSILYFHKIMIEAKIQILHKEPLVWINTAMLIYYTGNLFYFILFNLFLDYSHEFLKSIGIYFYILNGLFYVMIAVGFYLSKDGNRSGVASKAR